MPFERFDKRSVASTTSPFVTLQKRGPFGLNRSAYEVLGRPEAVELLYDRDEHIIGLKPVSPTEPYAFPVRPQGSRERISNFLVAGQSFTKHYGIDTSVARRYAAEMQGDILTVDLKRGGVEATGPRTKRAQEE